MYYIQYVIVIGFVHTIGLLKPYIYYDYIRSEYSLQDGNNRVKTLSRNDNRNLLSLPTSAALYPTQSYPISPISANRGGYL